MSTSSRQAWARALTVYSAADSTLGPDPETLFYAWIRSLQTHGGLDSATGPAKRLRVSGGPLIGAKRETPPFLLSVSSRNRRVSTATGCAPYHSLSSMTGTRPARLSVASEKALNRTLAGAHRGPRARVRRWLPGDSPAGHEVRACKGRPPDRSSGRQTPRSISGWPLRGDAPGGPVRRHPGRRSCR